MLIYSSNTILLTALFIALLILCGVFYSIFILSTEGINLSVTTELKNQSWWFLFVDVSPERAPIIITFVAILMMMIFSVSAGLLFRNLFRKTTSAEIFFFCLFIFSLSTEGLRIFNFLLIQARLPYTLTVLGTKAVLWGRISGLLFLFCASLYAAEFRYYKFGIIISITLAGSLILSYIIPVKTSIFLTHFIHPIGDEYGIFIISAGFSIITLINLLIASLQRDRQLLFVLIGFIFIIAGREMLFFRIMPVSMAAGFILLIAGSMLVYKKFESLYVTY